MARIGIDVDERPGVAEDADHADREQQHQADAGRRPAAARRLRRPRRRPALRLPGVAAAGARPLRRGRSPGRRGAADATRWSARARRRRRRRGRSRSNGGEAGVGRRRGACAGAPARTRSRPSKLCPAGRSAWMPMARLAGEARQDVGDDRPRVVEPEGDLLGRRGSGSACRRRCDRSADRGAAGPRTRRAASRHVPTIGSASSDASRIAAGTVVACGGRPGAEVVEDLVRCGRRRASPRRRPSAGAMSRHAVSYSRR